MIAVFRKGQWMQYIIDRVDPLWSQKDSMQAASFYATAVTKGFSNDESHMLAEAYINKNIYKVGYTKDLELKISSIMYHGETS